MSTDRETTRIVRSWLEEGVTTLPDRVLDGVLDELHATPQRRATWWPVRRLSKMNTTLKFGLAAAVVVVFATLIGINYFGTSNVGGPGLDSSTPSPDASSAEPSAESSAEPTPEATPVGLLPEGPHVLFDARGVRVTVTIPAPDWYGEPAGGILIKHDNSAAPDGSGMIGPFFGDIYVPADPCEWTTTMPDTPVTTVDEVVAALQGQASRNASEAVDITVDGHAGKSITLRVPDDAALDACDQGQFCTLTEQTPTLCHRYNQDPGQIDELWILEVDGVVMVFDWAHYDGTPEEHVAELRAIIESITFE